MRGISLCQPPLSAKPLSKPVIRMVRVGFWQNGSVADFYFPAPQSFRGFCRRIFFLFLSAGGGKVHRKILWQNPRQHPRKLIQQKFPTHVGRGQCQGMALLLMNSIARRSSNIQIGRLIFIHLGCCFAPPSCVGKNSCVFVLHDPFEAD